MSRRPSASSLLRPSPRVMRALTLAGLALGLSFSCGLLITSMPRLESGRYEIGDAAPEAFSFPLKFHNEQPADVRVRFVLHAGPLHPRVFRLVPDDCITAIIVNGELFADPAIPFCDYTNGRDIPIGAALHAGANDIEILVRNEGGDGRLSVETSWSDPAFAIPFYAAILFAFFLGLVGLKLREAGNTATAVYAAIFLGVALRLLYFLATPYWTRAHDVEGHIEYMRYLTEHLWLPPPSAGWEFYHPPLYYFLGSLILGSGNLMGLPESVSLRMVQGLSLLLSVGMLLLTAQIGSMLFTGKSRPKALPLFTLAGATLPGLVFFAGRINNDVLAAFFGCVTVAYALSWWKTRRFKQLALAAVATGLALLCKNSLLSLVPFLFACILFAQGTRLRQIVARSVAVILIIVGVAGWFSVVRLARDPGNRAMVGNVGNLNDALKLPNTPSAFLTFNPVQIVLHPYNSPWADEERRQYFWEYLFRAAFSGEFDFGLRHRELMQWTLAGSLVLLCLLVPLGIVAALLRGARRSVPVLALLFAILAAHAAFRWKYPYSSSQDFRYSTLVTLPLSGLALLGCEALPPPFQRAAYWVFQMCCALEAMLIVTL